VPITSFFWMLWNATLNGERIDSDGLAGHGALDRVRAGAPPWLRDPDVALPVLPVPVFLHSNGTDTPGAGGHHDLLFRHGLPDGPGDGCRGDGTYEWAFDGIFNASVTVTGVEYPSTDSGKARRRARQRPGYRWTPVRPLPVPSGCTASR